MEKSMQARMSAVIRQMNQAGIVAKRNAKGCCRSCLLAEWEVAESAPMFWSYGGQGAAVSIVGDDANADSILFYHRGMFDDSGEKLSKNGELAQAILERNGFKSIFVNDSRAVEVILKESDEIRQAA